jgi:thiol-disulfide isomerase/thioredoxin
MKKFVILSVLLACNIASNAQFKLSGRINNYSGKEQLKINIPQVHGFYKQNSINIPVAANGEFSIILPVKKQKFAKLIYKQEFPSLLLNVNKSLVVEINNKSLKVSGGTSSPENTVMIAINLEEYPAFMKTPDSLGAMNLAALYTKVVNPYFASRDEKIKTVNRSSISIHDKNLIATEIRSVARIYLNDLNWMRLKNKSTIDSLTLDMFTNNEVKPPVAIPGPEYYALQQDYLGYLQNRAITKMKKEKIPPNVPLPYYGMSLDSLNAISERYGNAYLRLLLASKNLPDAVTEQLAYQEIATLFYDKDMEHVQILAKYFKGKFPASAYNADINGKINALKDLLVKNETNKNIIVVNNYKNVNSIYDVIKDLAGKVVYLDVWGTWCGPCKEENKYAPDLKAAFKDKDVVFVYLDMDDENRDTLWKEFIKVNEMTGIHLRKNKTTIAPLWKELLADNPDKQEYYPQYFIFDKQGKILISKAKRPSDGEALYKDLEMALNK